jgi:Fe2+ or Zn2+ uptake regulation protein
MQVPAKTIATRHQNFEQVCRAASLPLTPQKSAIFTALASTTAHPSAQMLFTELRNKLPQLSLATVYKNLKQFEKLGLVRQITFPDGTARYDADISEHHHLINLDTKEVSDVFDTIKLPCLPATRKLTLVGASVKFFVRNH